MRTYSRRLAWLRWGLPLAVLLALIPIPVISRLEERDTFCASCHTAPEVTYFQRAQMASGGQAPVLDLSSSHYVVAENFRCINCHRGNMGAAHRVTTLALGARDLLIFISGRADQSIEKTKIEVPELLTAGCVECHGKSLLVVGFANHFHNKLPEAYALWKAGGKLAAPPDLPNADTSMLKQYDTSVRCLDCHRAHNHADGAELTRYLDLENIVFPACVQCHREVGHGPLELVAP
ncbi:MAG: hypothetical protein HY023_12265 [Chloroflexi bacterium]|nr:hypothetical protein [Chloroflexota bacterium]